MRNALNELCKGNHDVINLVLESKNPVIAVDTFEVDLSVPVRVEDVDDSLNKRILLQFGERHELVDGQGSRVVQVKFTEPFSQPFNLVGVDCKLGGRSS